MGVNVCAANSGEPWGPNDDAAEHNNEQQAAKWTGSSGDGVKREVSETREKGADSRTYTGDLDLKVGMAVGTIACRRKSDPSATDYLRDDGEEMTDHGPVTSTGATKRARTEAGLLLADLGRAREGGGMRSGDSGEGGEEANRGQTHNKRAYGARLDGEGARTGKHLKAGASGVGANRECITGCRGAEEASLEREIRKDRKQGADGEAYTGTVDLKVGTADGAAACRREPDPNIKNHEYGHGDGKTAQVGGDDGSAHTGGSDLKVGSTVDASTVGKSTADIACDMQPVRTVHYHRSREGDAKRVRLEQVKGLEEREEARKKGGQRSGDRGGGGSASDSLATQKNELRHGPPGG